MSMYCISCFTCKIHNYSCITKHHIPQTPIYLLYTCRQSVLFVPPMLGDAYYLCWARLPQPLPPLHHHVLLPLVDLHLDNCVLYLRVLGWWCITATWIQWTSHISSSPTVYYILHTTLLHFYCNFWWTHKHSFVYTTVACYDRVPPLPNISHLNGCIVD